MAPLRRWWVPLALPALLAACGDGPSPAAPAPLEGVRTQLVGSGQDGAGRSWDGVVEAVQQASLSAQTNGRVTEVRYDVNDRVAAGEVLLRLTAVEQQAGVDSARSQLRAAEAAAAEAESSYRRYAALAEGQYVSRLQLDQARATRDAAVAARDAARAQLSDAGQQTAYTVVRAPYAGIVAAREVEPGEAVVNGQRLMVVYAPGALRIEVQVPQADAELIRRDPKAAVRLPDGRQVEAAQVIVFPSADPASHSVTVRVQLPALEQPVAPGTTAKVVFPIGQAGGLPRIPRSAVVSRGEVAGVYVLADGRLGLRQIRLGAVLGDEVEVVSGLKAGERIASDPLAALQALARQRQAGAGHD